MDKGSKSVTFFVKDQTHTSPLDKKECEALYADLPELTFVVTKVFPWGQKKERILRLSKKGVENCRGKEVSSTHHYEAIICVEMRDLDTFVIHYDGDHDYIYKSPVGMQIVQEISSRVSIRYAAEKKKVTFDIALKYQEKCKQEFDVEVYQEASNGGRKNSGADSSKSKRATKLLNLLGSTEQQRLDVAVHRIVLDSSTYEAKTICEFIKNFDVLAKTPSSVPTAVRQFINGMKEYILSHREKDLNKLLIETTKDSFQPDAMSLSSTVEKIVENSIITPLQKKIINAIQLKTREGDLTLATRILSLKNRPQEYFGINVEYATPSNYLTAVTELNYITKSALPSDMVMALLATARSIYTTVNYEKTKAGKKVEFLSADDFLPIFIYVIVHADIDQLETLSEYIYELCDPELLNGEGGYYLTVFVSCLQYLKTLDKT